MPGCNLGSKSKDMAEREDPQEGLEKLTEAIVRAILSSEEVMTKIRDLQLGDSIGPTDILALALRFPGRRGAEVRVELIRGNRQETSEKEGPRIVKMEQRGSPPGRKLTRNEELFEQYLEQYVQEHFDLKAWLKKAGIQYDPKLEEEAGKEG